MPPKTLSVKRNTNLAKVHIAKKSLRLDEATYRDIILRVTAGKKNSSKSLTAAELNALIDEFKRLGWKPAYKAKKSGTAQVDFRRKRIWLIEKLWGKLGEAGVLTDPTLAGLEKYCTKYMLGDKLEWASSSEINSVVNALKGWERRVNISQSKEDLNRV